jgi:hypothetical protein
MDVLALLPGTSFVIDALDRTAEKFAADPVSEYWRDELCAEVMDAACFMRRLRKFPADQNAVAAVSRIEQAMDRAAEVFDRASGRVV